MIILGITGNTGSGKSSACKVLENKGALVLDADKISRIIMNIGEKGYEEVVAFFGEGILDSSREIIRKKLGEIVFSHSAKLRKLEEITHKYIIKYMEEKIEQAKISKQYELVVLDAPLLVESGLNSICHEIWLIDASFEDKIKRIMKRDNLSRRDAQIRLSKQPEPAYLTGFSNKVIYNDGDEIDFKNKVDECLNELLHKYANINCVEIKLFHIDKLDDVLEFERKLREYEDFWGWEIDEEYIESVKNSFVDERFKHSISMLAYDGGKVVGRIDTTMIASHFDGSVNAYLDWICVLKPYRHKGVARQLMEAMRKELKNRRVGSLVGIIARNEEAQSFYKAIEGAEINDEGIRIKIQ